MKQEPQLPISIKPRAKIRVKALLGHCLYRRVILWSLLAIACMSLFLFDPRMTARSKEVLDLVSLRKGLSKGKPSQEENTNIQPPENNADQGVNQNNPTAEDVLVEVSDEGDEGELPNEHWRRYKQ